MPTPQTEEFRCYHVPDEFMKVYKSLSRATEMMKNSWKKTLKNNPSYFTDPEKQKVLRFAMQRPANYLTEIETYLEKALAEALEEEKNGITTGTCKPSTSHQPQVQGGKHPRPCA